MSSAAPRVLALAGSARADSLNKRLLAAVSRGVEDAGVACTRIDLRDYPLPIYDGDVEASEGLPESAVHLRALFSGHQGLLIASPEYNGSIPPLLKNVFDWVTRSAEASPDLTPYAGKVALLASASPGPLGGMRGLEVVRDALTKLGVTVLAAQMTLRKAADAFAEDGTLMDDGRRRQAEWAGAELARTVRALASA